MQEIQFIAPAALHDEMLRLRNEKQMDFLESLTGMDWGVADEKDAPEKLRGLGVVYHLESTITGERIALKTATTNRELPEIPSVSDIWKIADFYEREVFDFYGITFVGHPDMRRLYLRNDWIGYPMRKDNDPEKDNPLCMTNEETFDTTQEIELNPDGTIKNKETKLFGEEEYVVNIGPQHPATHGVMRFRVSLEGEIIRKIDGDTVHIQVVDGTLTRITSESSLFDLNGSKSFDFPRIDLNKNGKHFSMKSYDFKKIIEKTLFATSEQETRPVLTGVNFKVDQHKLVCIATDSYRLAQVSMPIEDDIQFNIVIPKKSLNQIIHIIEKDEMIDLYVSDRKVLFVIGQYLVLTRLIDGTYPNTSRLVEDQGSYTMSINSSALLGAISRASLLSDEQSNIVKLTMSPDENVLSSYSQEIGSVEENLTKAFYKGEPMTISFSAKYLADAIRSIGTETIQLRFTEKMRPFQITGLDVNDNIQVVLPVRTY